MRSLSLAFAFVLYCEVANGEFGPDYGLVGVFAGHTDGGKDIVGLYRETQSGKWSRDWPRWPVQALHLLNWGCGMYLVVDCGTPDYRLFHFEPNISEEEVVGFPSCLIPHSIDLPRWWDVWLDGHDVMEDLDRAYGA